MPGIHSPFQVALLDHDHRHERQRDRGEQLVGDAEQREQRVDPAEWIGDAHQQDAAPQRDDGQAAHPCADPPARVAELAQRPAEIAQAVGKHEPGDSGAGVDRREDEQGLEHDREVVPERLQAGTAEHAVQDLRHADGQGRRPAGARDDRLLTDVSSRLLDLLSGDRVAGQGQFVDVLGGSRRGASRRCGRRVEREIQVLVQDRRGDQRHDRRRTTL